MNKNLWEENPSTEDLIRRRSPVKIITTEVIEKFISQSENAVRTKNIETFLGLFSPDFSIETFELIAGKLSPVVQNRDRYEMSALAWFDSSKTEGYKTVINSINIKDNNNAEVILLVSNSTDPSFTEYFGEEIQETATITLYEGIPVVSHASIKLNSA